VVWVAGAHDQPAEVLGATGAARFLSTADSVSAALAAQDAEPPRLRERLVLAPLPTAPRRARRFTEEVLARWEVSYVSDDAMLVVSELVTNGVQHAGSDMELRLEHGRGLLQIAVRDRGSPYVGPTGGDLPEAAAVFDGFHDTMLERGRGLEIVRTVADGAGQTDDPAGGSVYWATLRTAPRRGTGSDPVDGAVTETIVVKTGQDGHSDDGWTARLWFTWRPDDPQYVTLTLSATAQQPVLPGGRWRIRRESLQRALTAPVTDNGVEMLAAPDLGVVLFDLHTARLVRNAEVPAPRVVGFLNGLPFDEA
jgi:anti-sigma regulatory factor (Ser/Thr protein kinase)